MPRDVLILSDEIHRLQRQVDEKAWNREPVEADERELAHLRGLQAAGEVWLPTF